MIDTLLKDYQKLLDDGYVPNTILVEVDKDGYLVQQRGPKLLRKIKPEDISIKK